MSVTISKIFVTLVVITTVLAGCGTKDVDPQAKVDAPGYYNGEMKGKAKPANGPAGQGMKSSKAGDNADQ